MQEKKSESGVLKSVSSFFNRENRLRVIVALGVAGMALILISQFLSPQGSKKKEVNPNTAAFVSEQYVEEMEQKLVGLIGNIDGVGKAEVMVTLESGVEYVYVQEVMRNTDLTREEGAEQGPLRVNEREQVEEKYILVDQNGEKQPILETELQPRIQGVVIVCEGAGDVRVQQSLTSVITTALNIPSTRVCVVKIDTNSHSKREEAQ